MGLETKSNLNEESVDAIQDLIQINIDSYDGFKEAADQIQNVSIANLFTELASERLGQANELQGLVQRNNEEPLTEGSLAGQVHRKLMDWRQALGGGDLAVLKEAERGEDQIKEKYEDTINKLAGSAVSDVLHRQYAAVKRGHDRVRDLRDHYKNQ